MGDYRRERVLPPERRQGQPEQRPGSGKAADAVRREAVRRNQASEDAGYATVLQSAERGPDKDKSEGVHGVMKKTENSEAQAQRSLSRESRPRHQSKVHPHSQGEERNPGNHQKNERRRISSNTYHAALSAEQAGMLISGNVVMLVAQATSSDVPYIRQMLRSFCDADAYWKQLELQLSKRAAKTESTPRVPPTAHLVLVDRRRR